jgi:NADH dehydrogenase FAD-containing subunit
MKGERNTTVVVLGAGYAGVLAANRLAGRVPAGVRVLLINDRDELVHRVRLHEVAAGRTRKTYPLSALVHPRVERLTTRVTRIDATERRLVLADPARPPVAYDHLVYAAGSGITPGAPGVREHASGLAGPEQAAAFAARLRGLAPGAPVIIVGTGLSGIEAAAEVAESFPNLSVTLLGEELAPAWPDALRELGRAGLLELGVNLRTGVRVRAVTARHVELMNGERLAAGDVLWATGFSSSGLARDSGLDVDEMGRLVVDETLRAPAHPEIVGCGDAVAAPLACAGTGLTPMRMACATAMPMGAHAADVVSEVLRGRPARPFRYHNTVQCVSLGRHRGLLVFIDQDDRPTGRALTGLSGALAKELICRLVIGALRIERQMPGFYRWLGQRSLPPRLLGPGLSARMLSKRDKVVAS